MTKAYQGFKTSHKLITAVYIFGVANVSIAFHTLLTRPVHEEQFPFLFSRRLYLTTCWVERLYPLQLLILQFIPLHSVNWSILTEVSTWLPIEIYSRWWRQFLMSQKFNMDSYTSIVLKRKFILGRYILTCHSPAYFSFCYSKLDRHSSWSSLCCFHKNNRWTPSRIEELFLCFSILYLFQVKYHHILFNQAQNSELIEILCAMSVYVMAYDNVNF